MKNFNNTSSNYTGRTIDLLMLQTVYMPSYEVAVNASVNKSPHIVSGIEKLVQRFAHIFLTQLGTVKNVEHEGTEFITKLASGMIYDENTLRSEASAANRITMSQIKNADANEIAPADELLDSSEVIELSINRESATVMVKIKITAMSGDTYTYIMPIKAGV